MSGREFTGYHLTMFSFVLLILHFPYVFGLPFTIEDELKTISLFFIFIALWDFLWFVLNPYYPLKQFKKEYISWHPKWFLKAPVDYWFSFLISFLVIIPNQDFSWWARNIFLFSIQTIIVILFTLYILKIDNWNKND